MSTSRVCPCESEVLGLVSMGQWPARADAALRAHVDDCDVCGDLAAAAAAILELRDAPEHPVSVPDASVVWYRAQIHARITELIAEHAPREIAIERVFLSKNADSALKLGQARGAALAAVPQALGVHEYAPRAIKLAVVGVGGAEKTQVAHMVRQLLRLEARLTADAADALAVAIYHANSHRRIERLAGLA